MYEDPEKGASDTIEFWDTKAKAKIAATKMGRDDFGDDMEEFYEEGVGYFVQKVEIKS